MAQAQAQVRVRPAARLSPQRAAQVRRGLVGALVLLAAMEVLTRAELVNPRYMPPASRVVLTTGEILTDPEFLLQVLGTLRGWAGGMALAIAIAVPLGLLLGSSRIAYAATSVLVEFLRPIPSVAWIPLAILVFGRTEMRVPLACYSAVWPILINTIYGMHDVDPVAKETARTFGLGRLAGVVRVALPSAAPFIYTGVRIAAAIALIVVISTELIAGGGQGIGTWMFNWSASGSNPQYVYAGTIVAGLLGVALNALLVAGDRRWFAWHQRTRSSS
jgi:NitT/TauT family transport system permease protein